MTQQKIEINKKKFLVSFDPYKIEAEGLFVFSDLKEMTLFVNKLTDIIEVELNAEKDK